ncbi:MAG: DNA adenine methylase [Chloroflexi bacterium]|nr:DNA adenine methylase [Chloroflexota bacterium]
MGRYLSPLRYPGGKARLAPHLERVIKLNDLRPELFVEPFVGGGSVFLHLLSRGVVERAAVSDLDPLVGAFWWTVFNDTDWLVAQIEGIDISLDNWDRLKHGQLKGKREEAVACLFLNRTSFSGILARQAGPIGGRRQASDYTLDCRFPVKNIVGRILEASTLADRIVFAGTMGWQDSLKLARQEARGLTNPEATLFYFDPPFFNHAERLYNMYFCNEQHLELRDAILALDEPWLLSYDHDERVSRLYGGGHARAAHRVTLYTTSGNGARRLGREVIVSNLPRLV